VQGEDDGVCEDERIGGMTGGVTMRVGRRA